MAVSVVNQLTVFLLSVLCGTLAGLFFDFFRTFRRLVKSSAVWVGVQDLLFWFLAACAAFLFLYRFNDGQPRWYIFCGILLGTTLYHLLAGNYVVRFLSAAVLFCGRVLCAIGKILLYPFALIYRFLQKPVLFLWKPCRRFMVFFCRKTRYFTQNNVKNAKKIKKRLKMY